MDLNTSKVFNRAIDSVRLPLERFMATGFYDPFTLNGYEPEDIAAFQVRRACRKLAKEQKRPFIRCHVVETTYQWDHNAAKWVKLAKPGWEFGYVEVPKRKYLAPLVAPLLLAAPDEIVPQGTVLAKAPVIQVASKSLWIFHIRDYEFWTKYYDFILNNPDCRKARRLTA